MRKEYRHKKIIYIHPSCYTMRDYERFGAKYLQEHGYHVEMWWVDNGKYPMKKLNVSAGLYEEKNVFKLSQAMFEKRVKKNRDALFILQLYKNVSYMRIMTKYHCDYFLVEGGGSILLRDTITQSKDKKTLKGLYEFLIQSYLNLIQDISEGYLYFLFHKPLYVFLSPHKDNSWNRCVPTSKKIKVHSYDYDRYLEVKKYNEIQENCIVYVDGGFGNPDIDQYLLGYYDPWYKDNEIWIKLGEVFDRLEEHYNMPVIVAGHPHTKYKENRLCGRKVVANKTAELVASAKLVVMQCGTAISFVLLFKKPLLVLIDNKFKRVKNWEEYFVINFKYFKITPCNMDNEKMFYRPWEYVCEIEDEVAQKYVKQYIKEPGTPEKMFIEVIEEKIRDVWNNDK